jgi:hypothetical protein
VPHKKIVFYFFATMAASSSDNKANDMAALIDRFATIAVDGSDDHAQQEIADLTARLAITTASGADDEANDDKATPAAHLATTTASSSADNEEDGLDILRFFRPHPQHKPVSMFYSYKDDLGNQIPRFEIEGVKYTSPVWQNVCLGREVTQTARERSSKRFWPLNKLHLYLFDGPSEFVLWKPSGHPLGGDYTARVVARCKMDYEPSCEIFFGYADQDLWKFVRIQFGKVVQKPQQVPKQQKPRRRQPPAPVNAKVQ